MLFGISLSSMVLDISPQERETKAKISKQDSITLKKKKKTFVNGRKLSTNQGGHLLNGRKYFQRICLIRR